MGFLTGVLPQSRITRRILIALTAMTIVTLVCFALVSLYGMLGLGNYARKANVGLGQDAINISKTALTGLAEEGLLRLAEDQASLCNQEFEQIEGVALLIASYSRGLSDSPVSVKKKLFTSSDRPKNVYSTSVYRLAPGVSFDKVKEEVIISAQLDDLLKPIVAGNKNVEDIEVGFPSGLFRRYPWSGDLPKQYDPRQRDWYKRAVKDGHLGWTDPYISAITKELRVNCYVPVYKENKKLVSVIGTVVSIKTINDRIINSALLKKGKAVLVDRNLKIIAKEGMKAETQNWGDPVKGEFFHADREGPELKKMAGDITEGKPGLVRVQYGGRENFVAYGPVTATKWAVLVILPVESVIAPIRPTEKAIREQTGVVARQVTLKIQHTLLVLLFMFALTITAVLFVSRRVAGKIVSPVLLLDRGAKVVGDGNLDYVIDVKTGDEIEDLANTFNKMTSDLKKHIKDLTETTAAKERMQSELRVATEIQAGLLPKIFPPFPDRHEFDIYAVMDPAKEVGGDFYDFFFIDDKHLCFLIGDVSDKGVPAALFMMVTKTLLKTEAVRLDLKNNAIFAGKPEEVLFKVNNYIVPDNQSSMFVTIFCAVLNIETGEVAFTNAGHNPPLLLKHGEVEFLELPEGMVLGAFPDAPYEKKTLTMSEGDVLFLYTDGVTEAQSVGSDLFGEDRLVGVLSKIMSSDVEGITKDVLGHIRRFAEGASQSDDITIVALRFKGKKDEY